MRLTIVGCGDAFGSGGRFNTCFHLKTAAATLLVDCGASSPVALKACGLDHRDVDGIVLSHLHGDHFAGLPFILLDAQFLTKRERPLIVAGPPGTRARLDAASEALFPGADRTKWRFAFEVIDLPLDTPTDLLGHTVTTTEVVHNSGAPSTALRLGDGERLFAYSGDTEWTDALVDVADDADLFMVECYGYSGRISGHLTWDVLKSRLPDLRARRIMLTHMNPAMLAHVDEARAAGVEIAEDGMAVRI